MTDGKNIMDRIDVAASNFHNANEWEFEKDDFSGLTYRQTIEVAITEAIQQARSQAIDDCIKVVTDKIAEYGAATDITEAARWNCTSSLTVIASRLEALKGST